VLVPPTTAAAPGPRERSATGARDDRGDAPGGDFDAEYAPAPLFAGTLVSRGRVAPSPLLDWSPKTTSEE